MYIPLTVETLEAALAVVLGVLCLVQPKRVHLFVAIFFVVYGLVRLVPGL